MKNLILLLTVTLLIASSCKKKESAKPTLTEESKLTGRWDLKTINTKTYRNDQFVGSNTLNINTVGFYYVFAADKKITVVESQTSTTGTFTLSGDKLAIAASFQSLTTTLTSLSADRFTYVRTENSTSGSDKIREENEMIFLLAK